MNEITTTGNGPFNPSLKMSSLEIAELMEKRHDHVLRDIANLIDQEAITAPNFGASEYKDASGKMNPMYDLDFMGTMVLITGYDAKRRAIVIDRWIALERGEAVPAMRGKSESEWLNDYIRLLRDERDRAIGKVGKRKNFTKEEDDQVLELRGQGLSLREIGLRIGRKTESIRSCLYRLEGKRS